jgi:hypothetical protein
MCSPRKFVTGLDSDGGQCVKVEAGGHYNMTTDIVWKSEVTQDLVSHLTTQQVERLVKELDDVVYYALMSFMYEVSQEQENT